MLNVCLIRSRRPIMDTMELILHTAALWNREGLEIKGIVLEPQDYDKLTQDLKLGPTVGSHTIRIATVYRHVEVYCDKYGRR